MKLDFAANQLREFDRLKIATNCSIEKRFLITASLSSSGQILPETNSQSAPKIEGPISTMPVKPNQTLLPLHRGDVSQIR